VTAIDLVCWDFGGTLVDERWMRRPAPECPHWATLYDAVLSADPDWVSAWERGLAPTQDLVTRLSVATGLSEGAVSRHVITACEQVTCFPEASRAVRELRGGSRQACVTVNPDVFTRFVWPAYPLASQFEVVITSWETGIVEKPALVGLARARLGLAPDLGACLLIDDKAANLRDFVTAGGVAYHYRGDDAFAVDYRAGLEGLLRAASWPD
jgi:FMN phosphatase YigB (HAD superfamily)